MSYRNILFAIHKNSREVNHKWRKFQKSKLPSKVVTKPKTKIIEIEVPIDDEEVPIVDDEPG